MSWLFTLSFNKRFKNIFEILQFLKIWNLYATVIIHRHVIIMYTRLWILAYLTCLIVSILLQGGGWCNTISSCVFRKTTRRGSSKYMEKQLAFTGLLSNKAEENPGFSLYLTHACFIHFWRLQDMLTQVLCVLFFAYIFLCAQISLTGTELKYGTVMGHLSVEIVKTRLVRVWQYNSIHFFTFYLYSYWYIQKISCHLK